MKATAWRIIVGRCLPETPLHPCHLAAGATMVEFAGYDMPLKYSSIRDEQSWR